MKLAFLSFSISSFASNDHLYFKTASLALQQGHSVLISPYDWGALNAPEYAGIAAQGAVVHYRESRSRPSSFLARKWQSFRWLMYDPRRDFRFLEDWTPDVVVLSDPGTFHMLSAPGLADFLLSRTIPFVTISQFNEENSTLGAGQFHRARQFFGKAARCVFVSQRNLSVAKRQLCLNLEQAVVLENPPHLTSFGIEPFPAPAKPRMAIVARLVSSLKGHAIVLEILSQPVWRERQWSLNIYGTGPDELYLRELIGFYGLGDRVRLCGFCENVRDIWKENEILLLCSAAEGKPLAVTEALLCGRPAVVTDVAGNAELVEDGAGGFVAESPTVSSFTFAMERAWEARADWKSMGIRGHVSMLARLTPPPEEKLLAVILHAAGAFAPDVAPASATIATHVARN